MFDLEWWIEELEIEVMGLKCQHDQYIAAIVADLKDILLDEVLNREKIDGLYTTLGGI